MQHSRPEIHSPWERFRHHRRGLLSVIEDSTQVSLAHVHNCPIGVHRDETESRDRLDPTPVTRRCLPLHKAIN